MIQFANESPEPGDEERPHGLLHTTLHTLWGKGKEGPNYVKEEWRVLWWEVEKLIAEVEQLRSEEHVA